jgi:molecular chaperone DnaJ
MKLGTDDAFSELGLSPDASESEVKAAWRKLVSQWHPDRNDSALAVVRIQRINRAFEEIRRARQSGGVATAPTAARPARASGAAAKAAQRDAEVRARAKARADADAQAKARSEAEAQAQAHAEAASRRKPIHRKLRLTLEEAATGCIKVLRGQITEPCAECAGAGHIVLGGNCAQCRGSGAISKRGWFGWPSAVTECQDCKGGGIAMQSCAACDGAGKCQPLPYEVHVRIPPGVRNGDLLHVDARRPRRDRPPADLEIRIEVAAHPFFTLEDDGGVVRCEVPVDGFAWVAGRTVQVPTLEGLQPLKMRRDQLSYRLAGQGFPTARGGARGDQCITLVPVFPEALSGDQEILLDQLIATSGAADGQPSDPRLRAWVKGLRAWEKGAAARGE